VIVYAGAVMVLFVFTIMLLNAGEEEVLPHSSRVAVMLGVPGLIVGMAILIWVVSRRAGFDAIAIGGPAVVNGTESFGNPRAVAQLLFRDYLLPFEVTSVLILIAILGAVVLARREE
jgi:NADH-quinone oxidoreductase subunit J